MPAILIIIIINTISIIIPAIMIMIVFIYKVWGYFSTTITE